MLSHALVCFPLLLVSCATYPIPTASGRPEVTIPISESRAKTAAIDEMAKDGFGLVQQSGSLLTFQSEMTTGDGAVYLMAVGNSNYSSPVWISRLTFLTSSGGVKILGSIQASATGPFGQVKSTDTTQGRSGQRLQAILERVKARLTH